MPSKPSPSLDQPDAAAAVPGSVAAAADGHEHVFEEHPGVTMFDGSFREFYRELCNVCGLARKGRPRFG